LTWLVRRSSSLFFLMLAIIAVTVVIPANTEEGFGVFVLPKTMPTAAAIVIGLGALIALFEASGEDALHVGTTMRVSLFVLLLVASSLAIGQIGFKLAAPFLGLSVMMLAGERRWLWLSVGSLGMPLAIWLLFEVLLGRPLP